VSATVPGCRIIAAISTACACALDRGLLGVN
jgi:hypothetical protein